MLTFGYLKNNRSRFISFHILLMSILLIAGCKSSGGGGDENDQPVYQPPNSGQWEKNQIKHLDAGGLLITQVSARLGSDGDVRIVYFGDGEDYGAEKRYNINYIVWDPQADEILTEETLDPQPPETGGEGLDNCNPLALALDDLDYPIVAYQGGAYRDQAPSDGEQSDVMFSIADDIGWTEYTGAMGYVTRNPLYDGLAGSDLSVAVDSRGNIHICYQFYYEGMDSYNFAYPDLNYVRHDAGSIDDPIADGDWADIEETVYGSDFTGTSAVHRGVGYGCKLLLDDSNNPVVFFIEHTDYSNTYGLWFAERDINGDWDRQWIDQVDIGWTIGDVSAAKDPNGLFAVAYTKICLSCDADEGDHLNYAVQSGDTWGVQVVDNSSICGHSCSLAFDSQGNPAIAYYDQESHSGHDREYLRFGQLSGSTWTSEIVTKDDDFGHHNTLWFDSNDRPFICSYSEVVDDIAIFKKL